jgi:ABC-type transport system involved in multi-copper enzyme maturation permease subunit
VSATNAPRRTRVGAYALWQLRDYAKDRGIPTLVVGTLTGYLGLGPMLAALPTRAASATPRLIARYGSADAAYAARMAEFNAVFVHSVLGTLIFVGALFAMNGIVANDRKQGYFRFLFAKPVTPSRYYGQAFVVHWAGFLGAMTLLALVYGAVVWPVLTRPLLLVMALMFLCYAGIAFLLSAAARWDWLSLVAVSVVATLLWSRFGESGHPLARLLYLLPPLHRADDVYAAAAASVAHASSAPLVLPWAILAWLAGYGAICFVGGLVVLRYRRLAIV